MTAKRKRAATPRGAAKRGPRFIRAGSSDVPAGDSDYPAPRKKPRKKPKKKPSAKAKP